MSQQLELYPISLQYQLLGELQNAAIQHRRLLGKAGVPNKEILRLQNAGITDLTRKYCDYRTPASLTFVSTT